MRCRIDRLVSRHRQCFEVSTKSLLGESVVRGCSRRFTPLEMTELRSSSSRLKQGETVAAQTLLPALSRSIGNCR